MDPVERNPITGSAGRCARAASGHAAEPGDEFAPSKMSAHLPLPFQGTLWRQNSPSLWGLPDRLLHCGISVASADGFMAEMGHEPPN